jgi:NADH-quinone oxidoreductase subunit C
VTEEHPETAAAIGEPAPADPSELEQVRAAIEGRLAGAVSGVDGVAPEGALVVARDRLLEVCELLKSDPTLGFTLPLFCTAIDWLEREPRFDLVYQLRSLLRGTTIRLKVRVPEGIEEPAWVPSTASIWQGMGWQEREVFDLFGIDFRGHPDLRRLMMPADWEGHPLRKDYISFGEAVKFSDRESFAPDSAVPQGAPD